MSLWQLRARRNRPAPDPRALAAPIFCGAGGFGISAVRAALLGSVSLGALAMLGPNPVHAQDATWTGSADSNWNNDINWSPAGAPAGTATFSAAPTTSLTFSSSFTTIDTLQFTTTAPAYSYNLFGQALVIGGAGVLNSSSNAPTFNAFGLLEFDNAATAGNAIINNTPGATTFTGTSTAANATITNSFGGLVSFTDNSTAGSALITTNLGSLAQFFANSTGGNAQFITAGTVDFSGTTGPNGDGKVSAGSIAGAGTYFLGSNQLTVGSNNLSTIVDGTIEDGGSSGGSGASLVKIGAGTLTLTGANTYTGGTIISGGALQLGNGGASGAILGDVVDNGIFAINRSDTFTFGGVISGTGAFMQLGPGTTVLTGANTYTGATNVNAGTLQAGAANAFSPFSAFTVASGATLDLNSFNQTIGSLAGAGNVTLGAATLTTGNDNTSTTFSGAISGTGGLTKSGAARCCSPGSAPIPGRPPSTPARCR